MVVIALAALTRATKIVLCVGVRASRSSALGEFITACWVLIYTQAQVCYTPAPIRSFSSVCFIPLSGIGLLSLYLMYSNPPPL